MVYCITKRGEDKSRRGHLPGSMTQQKANLLDHYACKAHTYLLWLATNNFIGRLTKIKVAFDPICTSRVR